MVLLVVGNVFPMLATMKPESVTKQIEDLPDNIDKETLQETLPPEPPEML